MRDSSLQEDVTCVVQGWLWLLVKDPSFSRCFAALVVRFLTKRFIGDYEANTGEFCSPQQHCRELGNKSTLVCDWCTLQESQVVLGVHKVHIFS